MWVVCVACHHYAEISPLPRYRVLRCTACGSRVARTATKLKSSMLNGGQTEAGEAKVLTYAGLLSIANERGYKVGWAAVKYQVIYREWPPDGDKPAPQNPSAELMWWIKQQNIAYAKANFPREKKPPKPVETKSSLMSSDDWEVDL